MATVSFRFFEDSNGDIRVWPPFNFIHKPFVVASKVEFVNLSDQQVELEDRGGALDGSTPGQANKKTIPSKKSDDYPLAATVAVGQAYRFDVVSPPPKGSSTDLQAFAADSPEIIITG